MHRPLKCKGLERNVESPGIEHRAFDLPCQCSVTELYTTPTGNIPLSCPYVACSSLLLNVSNIVTLCVDRKVHLSIITASYHFKSLQTVMAKLGG